MKPSQISSSLRQIASKIDASKNPSRILVARELRRVLAAMGAPTLVLMHGPWGFMGYEVSDATPALAQLVAQANDAIFASQNIRGGIEIVTDKGDNVDGDDGQWTPTTEAVLSDALRRAMAGDDEALMLHG